MGINTGHLGYLADVQISESETILDDITTGNYKIEERSLIEVVSSNAELDNWPFALNEVAILKQDTASMISIKTEINDVVLNTYIGDGLIISTPTGSTGYNLSVGGPIIEPTAPNWVISPIAAHSLTMRPLVVSNESVIKATTTSRATNYRLSLDGRSITLPEGSSITLRKAPFGIKVAQRLNHHFTDTLRNKLLWGIDKR
jgi:NAD+ kinase